MTATPTLEAGAALISHQLPIQPSGRSKSTYRLSLRTELILGIPAITAFVFACGWNSWQATPVYFLGSLACCVAWVTAGIVVRREMDRRRLGIGLICCGITWALRLIVSWDSGPLPLIGIMSDAIYYLFAGWAILANPDSRKLLRREQITVFLISLVLLDHIILTLYARPEWHGFSPDVLWFSPFATTKAGFEHALMVVYFWESVLGVFFLAIVMLKLRDTRGIEQSISRPIAIGFCIGGIMGASALPGQAIPSPVIATNVFLVSLAFLAIPAGVLLSRLRERLTHADIARTIHQRFANVAPTGDSVRDTLRCTLHDSSLEIYYWTPQQRMYVDEKGQPASSLVERNNFVRSVATSAGDPLAVIVSDTSLQRHAGIVDTAVNACSIALENARLQAVIRSQLQEVRRSRTRIVEAGLEERRRIERDLHDGIQQRLLALGVRIGSAKNSITDSDMQQLLTDFGEELHSSLKQLRDLAHGIHPPELRQFGLGPTIQAIAERSLVPTDVNVDNKRYSENIESTIYFVVCEALTNVAKHANATHASVSVVFDGNHARVRVIDNGLGGVNLRGNGILGLIDRAETLGGQLRITSESAGTSLEMEIPCE